MEAYKIKHTPTGKYLSKYVGKNKWKLGPKGKTWSCKLPSLIKGGVVIDDKLIPESEFRFVELTTIDKRGLIEKIETLFDNKEYIYDTKTINDILGFFLKHHFNFRLPKHLYKEMPKEMYNQERK